MDPEPVTETSAAAGWHEDRAPPVGQPQDAAAGSGEHELVSVPADHGRRQLDGQEPGQRDGAGLMRFRGAEDDTGADIRERAADIDATAVEVDVADSQGGCLAPAQPASVSRRCACRRENVTAPGSERRALSGSTPPPSRAPGDLCRPSGPDGEGQAKGQAQEARGEPSRATAPVRTGNA
jgi:hypothetical protein